MQQRNINDAESVVRRKEQGGPNPSVVSVHPNVPNENLVRLEKLLHRFSDILSKDEFDMGLTDLMQHEIDTRRERPVQQPLRKTPMAHNSIIDSNIQSMLKQVIIEPSKGDWSSNSANAKEG